MQEPGTEGPPSDQEETGGPETPTPEVDADGVSHPGDPVRAPAPNPAPGEPNTREQ